MASESELRCTIRADEAAYDQKKSTWTALQQQVDQLVEVREHVRKAKLDAQAGLQALRNLEPSSSWRGKRRRGFDNAMDGDIVRRTARYVENIDLLEAQITQKMQELNNQARGCQSDMATLDARIGRNRFNLKALLDGAVTVRK